MRILNWTEISENLKKSNPVLLQEEGFLAYSEGRVVSAPVGHLDFPKHRGECHIKSGYIPGEPFFVIKAATCFYENPNHGLSSGNGMMMLWNQKTGVPEILLNDEGRLTDIRTALAGAIVAKYLAPKLIRRIGIVGTGTQARLQLLNLRSQVNCRDVLVWGRSEERLKEYLRATEGSGFNIQTTTQIEDIAASCNLIVTTTPSEKPILFSNQIRPGTHITAVGADSPGKQELESTIFLRADIKVVDSVDQCSRFGEAHHAIRDQLVSIPDLVELGEIIHEPQLGRQNDDQITVADLTGLAIQDLQIAKAALGASRRSSSVV